MEHSGIIVENVYKSFGRETVLEDVSLSIPPGEIAGVVGNNGSGKTVLMKCICGFLRPDKGSVTVNGARVGRDRDFPPSLGIIIETPGFIPNMSGYRNLKTLASLRGLIGKREILAALDRVGLAKSAHKAVSKYSLGMRQRLGIAQAVMEDPAVLILDEPFNGLDKSTAEDMRGLLIELRDRGKAILLASHNARDIEELCGWVYEMDVHKA
ncbi:ABC transporter ATP-binding protein [Acutalibacter muris]|uniref:ABC transporter ATP-binding protein n=1 Tax=Acutalibacter muris TaxID=1796620 RepID=A0A1Z2XN52_9FIRM|nr:ABC transporter ATP-binding protein [Acutalibacter muris]ANU53451.1 multidrug ABC transporter ATP-binding protein [Hungateiclostridiaceae bacterium KB18]ASB39873.1 ABC transporter ATP-binding protein [Acutalibacter muris]QQR29162.1 ABC transporter ATP-binding protein [Acutalibacter muris]